MVRLLTIATALAAIQYSVTAVNLKDIDPKTVEKKHDGALIVEYYKPECKNCADFEPKWNQLANSHPHASFGKINCDQHASYCTSKGIVRFPTIQSNINGGEWHEYTGDYSLDSVDKFIERINVNLTRNQAGSSIELKTSQQLKDIIESKEPWFVKFYAPWCGHCKHLQPIWNDMAKKLKNKVNVGEVNCEESKALCQEYRIAGLPTLNYFVHGVSLKYTGKRELEPLQEYALQMAGSPVHEVKNDAQLEKLMKQADVNFVYVRESGNTIHQIPLLETIAPAFMETIPFYTSTDKKTALRFNLQPQDLPASVIVKDGTVHVFKQDIKDLAAWVISESEPLLTRVLPHNSNAIMKGKQVVVLGITKPDDTDSEWKLREMAKIYRDEQGGQDITFAQLDGKLWGNFISRAYGIQSHKLPAIVVLDPKQEVYFDRHANDVKFSFESPDEILESIKHLDQLTGSSTAPSKTMNSVERFFIFFGEYWMVLTPIVFGVFALVFYIMVKDDPAPLTREEMKQVAKKVVQDKKKEAEKKKD